MYTSTSYDLACERTHAIQGMGIQPTFRAGGKDLVQHELSNLWRSRPLIFVLLTFWSIWITTLDLTTPLLGIGPKVLEFTLFLLEFCDRDVTVIWHVWVNRRWVHIPLDFLSDGLPI